MNRFFISTIALVFCGLFSGAALAQHPRAQARVILPPPPPPALVQLERGDVITSVNGRPVRHISDFTREVDHTRGELYMTVLDRRSGREIRISTHLDRRGHRLGVVVRDLGPGRRGVVIQDVIPGSAAQRCRMEGHHHPGPPYGGPHHHGDIAVRTAI